MSLFECAKRLEVWSLIEVVDGRKKESELESGGSSFKGKL